MVESAPGEDASVSSTDSGKDSSVECPTCGKAGFDSVHYMKVHHSLAHGESIAGKLIECDWCGKEFRRNPSAAQQCDSNYCSKECHSEARSEHYSGEGHPRWIEDKPTVDCEYCGDTFEVWPANIDVRRFCGRDCKADWQSENVSGENHHQYSRVTVECDICGEKMDRKPSHVEGQENVFCSQDCHREYQSRHQVGENHHSYEGGRTQKYGPNWGRQRTKAIRRDNAECQRCGVHRSELDRDLDVHHIEPRTKFIDDGEFDYERANRLDNLICLCGSCHRICESWGLRLANL